MSWYWGFRYKGIVKEKYRRDIAAAFNKGCWSTVVDDELKRMIYALYPYVKGKDYYPEEETEFMEEVTCFGGYCDSPDYLIADFDEKSGLLIFYREWNHHHASKDEEMKGIENVILPFITESVILFDSWFEPISDNDTDEHIPNKDLFEEMMKSINELYKTKGMYAVLQELPHGSLLKYFWKK